jgi:DNA polymerase I
MSKKRLYLIDATAFCYRAFYALKGLSTSFGQPTNAVYGFINMLNKILKEKNPDYLSVCFDVSRDTFRQKKFAEYKIQRPPMPDGLVSQIPFIKQIISAYGIAIFEKEGYEADDIIATLARRAKEKGLHITIVSSDKDMLQLVDKDVLVFSPYKDEGLLYDRDKVISRFGVEPEKINDIVALMGDQADNIPGVPGIGEKTASSLIKSFGSIDKLLQNIEKIKQEKIRKTIKDNADKAILSKELSVLDDKVDIDFDPEKLKPGQSDYKQLFQLFKYLEFKRLLKELPKSHEDEEQDFTVEKIADDRLKELASLNEELILYAKDCDDLVIHTQGKTFRPDLTPGLKKILSDSRIRKTGHDLKEIKACLAKTGVALEGLYFDTMIAAYLINPSKPGYSLADVCLDFLDNPVSEGISSAEAASLIAELTPILKKELAQKELTKLFSDIEMPLVEVLAQMEINGIKLDLAVIKKISSDIEARLIKLIDRIYALSGVQFNINSPKQLREILFDRLKLPVIKRSKTGPSTDEEVLRGLADKHELPAFLLEYRQLMKLKNTYIDTLPELVDDAARIHTSFNQTGTETGRLSSSEPNLQNIPVKTDIGRSIRKAIVSSDAHSYLLSCDYSQIELRILAHLSGDKSLIAAFKDDKDIHKATASLIYGLEEKDITDEMRGVAKRINFAIVYGLTAFGLSRDLNIALDEAQSFIDAYFSRYPGVRDYIDKQVDFAQKNGFVMTLLGRRRYIPEINDKNTGIREFAKRKAINTPIQGTASDLIKLAMVDIHREIKRKNLKTEMILQIHDELIFDVPEEELEESSGLVRERMENVLRLDVPIRVDIKKGRNWLEMEEV